MFGTKAPFLVDLFLAGLVAVLIAMLVAIRLVRRGQVKAHARAMAASYVFFLAAVIAFEVQVNLIGLDVPLPVVPLAIHLPFAIPCLIVWTWQIATAQRALTDPASHKRRGMFLMTLLALTVATGFWLYWATFAA